MAHVDELISSSVTASERLGFARLVDRMELGDVVDVTKQDRLGNAMDVSATEEALAGLGVKDSRLFFLPIFGLSSRFTGNRHEMSDYGAEFSGGGLL
ncbi:hypothetical protein CRM91_24560 [Burkholderia ambifaria]|uniref:hypothetical protein n=1 Tax=Burkholderia ambifaria TaxID=152480 RepID=UPI00068053E5|nr:hypothetical protein [Burkholderia ambifaria]MBR7928751.1 hypothetical protein [Burkholderia ambifaria]PEH65520.1 hypothetical protein CRM91_24560 [Burkholderia ambifaria]QQC05522.1 hypothetical protein I6H84_06365 [Burkholderia ambifaria]UZU03698.1 hypothetical protein OR987_25860 [Burkholderia ambifaria]UZU10250.1 hypothetical protein OR988_25855 [Burkholderia ambifaria]